MKLLDKFKMKLIYRSHVPEAVSLSYVVCNDGKRTTWMTGTILTVVKLDCAVQDDFAL